MHLFSNGIVIHYQHKHSSEKKFNMCVESIYPGLTTSKVLCPSLQIHLTKEGSCMAAGTLMLFHLL